MWIVYHLVRRGTEVTTERVVGIDTIGLYLYIHYTYMYIHVHEHTFTIHMRRGLCSSARLLVMREVRASRNSLAVAVREEN